MGKGAAVWAVVAGVAVVDFAVDGTHIWVADGEGSITVLTDR
jgi:hypothetical protein